jgi:hypothetical protein
MGKSLMLAWILAACGSSSPPRERSPKPDDAAVVVSWSTTDAAIETSTDAPVDASVGPPIDARSATSPSPPVYVFPITSMKESDGGTQINIRAGSKQGVSKSWQAFLVGDDDRPVENGELVIRALDRDRTVAWSRLHVAIVEAKYRRVRFEPR